MVGIAGCMLALIDLELTFNRVTTFFSRIFESEGSTILLTTVTSLVAVRYYFSPGKLTWAADAGYHAYYVWIASEGIAQGIVPILTPLVSAGSPFLQFYGPFFFYLVALLNWVVGDLEAAIKGIIGLAHAASGVTCYLYVRTLTGNRRLGYFAGLCYVLSLGHLQQVLIMGRLPVCLVYTLLPLPFYAFERLRIRVTGGHTSQILGALSLAILAFTHPGYAFWTTAFFTLYLLIRSWGNEPRGWFDGSIMLLGGVFLGSYLLLTTWMEREWTDLYQGFSL